MTGDIVKAWYAGEEALRDMPDDARLKKWEKSVAAEFKAGARVLDIGCGAGREAFALHDMGCEVVGIDISEPVIAKARAQAQQTGRGAEFRLYDGHRLPFEDSSFDAVIIWAQTFGLLYGDTYKEEILAECARVMKRGAILSFSGHDHEYLMENYPQFVDGRAFYPFKDAPIYWESFLPVELIGFAKRAGFAEVDCRRGEIYTPEDGTVLRVTCKLS